MKKIFSAVLAGATMLSMSASAFAVSVAGPVSSAIAGEGTTEAPIILVDVPANLNYTLDPYNLNNKGHVVPTAATAIVNKSNVPVNIMVTSCKGTIPTGSGAKLGTETAPTATTTTKEAQLFLRAVVTDAAPVLADDFIGADKKKFTAATETKAGDVLVTSSGKTNSLLCTLGQGTGSAAGSAKGYALVSMAGVAANKAVTSPWVSGDEIDVSVALSILPQIKDPSSSSSSTPAP